jgi:DNA-binding response OmpR family regulator
MKRILIVDDENLIRSSLSTALRHDDTFVKAFEYGKDALNEIDQMFFDLCFLDVNLPDMNGLDIMRTIHKVSPATKIVIMTAGEVKQSELQSIQANANLLVPKPFNLDRIKLFVERIMGQGVSMRQTDQRSYHGDGHASFENWIEEDKRKSERKACEHQTTCALVSDQGEKQVTAKVLDISDDGMCLHTDHCLKPGNLLRFYNSPERSTGVVRWAMNADVENFYRAGIQFVSPGNAPYCFL